MVSITRHVNGTKYTYTKRAEEVLAKVVKCYVRILTDGNKDSIFETDGNNVNVYDFLQYDNDEDNCVISGPNAPHFQLVLYAVEMVALMKYCMFQKCCCSCSRLPSDMLWIGNCNLSEW